MAKERRERGRKSKNEKWEVTARTVGKFDTREVWTWNVQRASVSFPRRNRFSEILRIVSRSKAEIVFLTELREEKEGIKWIKAGDLFGVLVHGMKSGVLLRDAWAMDWKDQGEKRTCGQRNTSVVVNKTHLISTYQPVWGGDSGV